MPAASFFFFFIFGTTRRGLLVSHHRPSGVVTVVRDLFLRHQLRPGA